MPPVTEAQRFIDSMKSQGVEVRHQDGHYFIQAASPEAAARATEQLNGYYASRGAAHIQFMAQNSEIHIPLGRGKLLMAEVEELAEDGVIQTILTQKLDPRLADIIEEGTGRSFTPGSTIADLNHFRNALKLPSSPDERIAAPPPPPGPTPVEREAGASGVPPLGPKGAGGASRTGTPPRMTIEQFIAAMQGLDLQVVPQDGKLIIPMPAEKAQAILPPLEKGAAGASRPPGNSFSATAQGLQIDHPGVALEMANQGMLQTLATDIVHPRAAETFFHIAKEKVGRHFTKDEMEKFGVQMDDDAFSIRFTKLPAGKDHAAFVKKMNDQMGVDFFSLDDKGIAYTFRPNTSVKNPLALRTSISPDSEPGPSAGPGKDDPGKKEEGFFETLFQKKNIGKFAGGGLLGALAFAASGGGIIGVIMAVIFAFVGAKAGEKVQDIMEGKSDFSLKPGKAPHGHGRRLPAHYTHGHHPRTPHHRHAKPVRGHRVAEMETGDMNVALSQFQNGDNPKNPYVDPNQNVVRPEVPLLKDTERAPQLNPFA